MTVVTHHGEHRIRERCGLPKKAVKKLSDEAWRNGSTRWDYAGGMRRYLDALTHRGEADDIRVYNGFVFIFDKGTLISAWCLPPRFRRYKSAALKGRGA